MRYLWHLCLFVVLGVQPIPAMSPDQALRSRANHWIETKNAEDKAAGCSATAISPHALLTAHHCDLPEATVSVDDAPGIVPDAKIFDKYDGMILVFKDWDFKDVVPLDAQYGAPVQGERLFMFGNPAGIRNVYREGVLAGVTPDEADGIAPGMLVFVGTMNVVGGDSGSSIYANDGRRVGVLTYGIFGGKFCGFFPLTFTPEQIRAAA